jgi:hypothetical protein
MFDKMKHPTIISDPTLYCRVCGLHQGAPQWGEDGLTPTFQICDCCGVQFGYEDCTAHSITSYRKKWIEGGRRWFTSKARPQLWDFSIQEQQAFNTDE